MTAVRRVDLMNGNNCKIESVYCCINITINITTSMDKRLNKKLEVYVIKFKDDLRDKINGLDFTDKGKAGELVEFIYEYERLALTRDDFSKRKRVKNSIPGTNRCSAKRASGEQCTRRRKEGCEFCGTHFKGAPHGLITSNVESETLKHSLEVNAEDIDGIIYYIDKYNNVYKTEDILKSVENPQVIGTYKKPGLINYL